MKKNVKNVMSKLMLFTGILIMALSFNSCNKDKDEEQESSNEAGKIPGLGNTPGNLTGTPFTLPPGVVLTGDITGDAYQGNYWDIGEKSYSYISKAGTVETRTLASPSPPPGLYPSIHKTDTDSGRLSGPNRC